MSKTLPRNAAGIGKASSTDTAIASLGDFRWKNRVIVIFPDLDNAGAARQENMLLADREGLAERDVVVLKVAGRTVRSLFGASPDLEIEALARDLRNPAPGEFAAFLVGKDGTVKLAVHQPISTGELLAIIDAMPMRAAEAADDVRR